MNMPSFYQDGLFNGLIDSGEVELRVVFARKTALDRLQLGWEAKDRNYPHRFLSGSLALWDTLRIAWSERDRLHIVNGIGAEPAFAVALFALALARSRFVVYAEAFDRSHRPHGIRSLLRASFGRWIARRALGMLAISHFAEQFYTQLGFDDERIYQFGYFRSNNDRTQPGATHPMRSKRTEVIFAGQLIHRKGVDLLLEAIQPLFTSYPDLYLSVIGSGKEATALHSRALALRMADRVNFEGTVSSDTIQARIALADVLVLPSRWDGWGMVVNEALSAGVPVIVSDHCGAADLIQAGVNGYVFHSEDVEHLRKCLQRFLDNLDDRVAMQSAAAGTGRAVSAEVAAPYLIDCLKHMIGESEARPTPPWLLARASQSTSH
jgi:glycosyltransferase involved in cell wall biosynthesis